jgi:hypothetical protein
MLEIKGLEGVRKIDCIGKDTAAGIVETAKRRAERVDGRADLHRFGFDVGYGQVSGAGGVATITDELDLPA